VRDPHTQIAVGLEQLVILARVTFDLRNSVEIPSTDDAGRG